jgi:hypothetical protein
MVMTIEGLDPMVLTPVLSLPGISLQELRDEAAFLTRKDRKYIVGTNELVELLRVVESGTRALEISGVRTFSYATQYFDDAHTAYFRALRRRPDRFKVRTRFYEDSGECQLEVKLIDGRGRTVKSRMEHGGGTLDELSAADRAWLRSFAAVRPVALRLSPSVATHYRRSTLVFPGGTGRMTIDQHLTFIDLNGSMQQLDGHCVVETKGHGHPLPFDRLLWRAGFRPVPASKFALGVCLAHPELPANRWHRLRRRLEYSLLTRGACSNSIRGSLRKTRASNGAPR